MSEILHGVRDSKFRVNWSIYTLKSLISDTFSVEKPAVPEILRGVRDAKFRVN